MGKGRLASAVLLLVLTAPSLGQQPWVGGCPEIVLPVASTAELDKADDIDKRWIISLSNNGLIRYKGVNYNLAELKQLLNRLRRLYGKYKDFGRPPRQVKASELFLLLYVDRDVPWRHVQWVMTVIREERIYKVQFAAMQHANLDYTVREAAQLGSARRHEQPRRGRLHGKLLAFLGCPFRERDAKLPRIEIAISGKDFKSTQWGPPESVHEEVFPPQSVTYRIGDERTDRVLGLGGWIRDELANLPEKQSRLDVVGRIEAEADTPFKFVVAALNQLNEARVHRIEFGPAHVPDAAVRKRAYLPYPKTR